jgi:hypothetical protein
VQTDNQGRPNGADAFRARDKHNTFAADRFGHNYNPGAAFHGPPVLSKIKYMAHAKGYVMAKRPGRTPFVITEKQWLEMPLWSGDQ